MIQQYAVYNKAVEYGIPQCNALNLTFHFLRNERLLPFSFWLIRL